MSKAAHLCVQAIFCGPQRSPQISYHSSLQHFWGYVTAVGPWSAEQGNEREAWSVLPQAAESISTLAERNILFWGILSTQSILALFGGWEAGRGSWNACHHGQLAFHKNSFRDSEEKMTHFGTVERVHSFLRASLRGWQSFGFLNYFRNSACFVG